LTTKDDGTLYEEGRYENGRLVYSKEYSDGKPTQTRELINGSLEVTERYDENGKKK
jgi:hypothetical protein